MEKDSRFITFLRPRRFGKSLLVSTLYYYYDLKSAPLFEKLFSKLYIGKHPTSEKNAYYVLKLNFSELELKTEINFENSFENMVINQLKRFIEYYAPKNQLQDY